MYQREMDKKKSEWTKDNRAETRTDVKSED
jgi:hypothetical protein